MNNYPVFPNKIIHGAKVAFFSPSDPIYPRRIDFIKQGVEILDSWGFKTEHLTDSLFRRWSELRSINDRINEFNEKLNDPDNDILIATWGGKNSNDLLDRLDYELIRKLKKPIIGSSDVAVMLNAITSKSRLITFYGPNVLGKLNQTKEVGLPKLTSISENTNLFPQSINNSISVIKSGKCKGVIIGGSLGTFTLGLSGTTFIPTFQSTIFFFESSSLDLFRIRQHLQNLKLTGFLKNVVGLIIGVNTQITSENISSFIEMIIEIFPREIPIVSTELFGHGFYYNPTIPIGAILEMDTENFSFKINL